MPLYKYIMHENLNSAYRLQATYLRHEVMILFTVHIKWQGWLIVWNSFVYLRRFLIL